MDVDRGGGPKQVVAYPLAIQLALNVLGLPPLTTQEERLQNLINFGSQFDSFTIR